MSPVDQVGSSRRNEIALFASVFQLGYEKNQKTEQKCMSCRRNMDKMVQKRDKMKKNNPTRSNLRLLLGFFLLLLLFGVQTIAVYISINNVFSGIHVIIAL